MKKVLDLLTKKILGLFTSTTLKLQPDSTITEGGSASGNDTVKYVASPTQEPTIDVDEVRETFQEPLYSSSVVNVPSKEASFSKRRKSRKSPSPKPIHPSVNLNVVTSKPENPEADEFLTHRKVFVGSSTEGKPLAEAVIAELRKNGLMPLEWFNFFQNNRPPLQELEQLTLQVEAAVLIATPDDQAIIRQKKKQQMRDNVLFEYGLFSGALGRSKCGLLVPDTDDFRIPSDFLGVACYKTYTEDNHYIGATEIAISLASTLGKPVPQEDRRSRGRRLLQLIGWLRNETFKLIQDWDNSLGKQIIADRIVAVSGFVKEDIDSLGLRKVYNVLERDILAAVNHFPQYSYEKPNFERRGRELIMELAEGRYDPDKETYYGLADYFVRYHNIEVCNCDIPNCNSRFHRGFRNRWSEDYPRYHRYWHNEYRGRYCWNAHMYTLGVAEATSAFRWLISENGPEDVMRSYQFWSTNYISPLNESIEAFERRLHEVIFGQM